MLTKVKCIANHSLLLSFFIIELIQIMFKKRNKQTTGIDINEIEHKNHEKEPET